MDLLDLIEYTWAGGELSLFFKSLNFFLSSMVPTYFGVLFIYLPHEFACYLELNFSISTVEVWRSLTLRWTWLWGCGDGFLESTLKWFTHGAHQRVLKYAWFYQWIFKYPLFIFPKWSTTIVFDHYFWNLWDFDKIPIEYRTFRTYTPRSVFLAFFFCKFLYKTFFPYLAGPYLKGVWRSESEPLAMKLAMHMAYKNRRVLFRKRQKVKFLNRIDRRNRRRYRNRWPDYYDPNLRFSYNLATILSWPYSFVLAIFRFVDVYMRFHTLIIGLFLLPIFAFAFYFWDSILPVRRWVGIRFIFLFRGLLKLLSILFVWRRDYYFYKVVWIFWVAIYLIFFLPFNFLFSVGFFTPLMWALAYPIYFFSKRLIEVAEDYLDLFMTYFIWILWDIALPIWEEILIWDEATDRIIEVEPRIELWVMQWLFLELSVFLLYRILFNRWYYPWIYYLIHRPLARIFGFLKLYVYDFGVKPFFLGCVRWVLKILKVPKTFILFYLRYFLRRWILSSLHLFLRRFYLYRRFYRFCHYHRVHRLWSVDYRFLRKNRFRRRGKGRIEEFESFSKLNYTWIMREITLPDMVPFETFWRMERRRFYDRGRSARSNVEGWIDELLIGKPYFAVLSSLTRFFVSSVFLLFIFSDEGQRWFVSTIPTQARMFAEVYILTIACFFLYFTFNWFRYWFTLHATFYFAVVFCCWHSGFWLLFPIDGTFFESNALLNIYLYPNFIEFWYVPLKAFAVESWSMGALAFEFTKSLFFSSLDQLFFFLEFSTRMLYHEKPGMPDYEDSFGGGLARELVEFLV